MSCKCELTGVRAQFGNNVSHSQRKTRRRFNPNIRVKHYRSELTGQNYKMTIIAKTMRTIEKHGGFDFFMLNADPANMSDNAKSIKKNIVKKQAEAK